MRAMQEAQYPLCKSHALTQVYAPHTGNPNVRKARERALHNQQINAAAPSMRVTPFVEGSSAPFPRRERGSTYWNAFLPNLPGAQQPAAVETALSSTDTSGDEPDSDGNTIDSLDSHFHGMRWETSSAPRSFGSISSSDDNVYLFGMQQPAQTSGWQAPEVATTSMPIQQGPTEVFPSNYAVPSMFSQGNSSQMTMKAEDSQFDPGTSMEPAPSAPQLDMTPLAPSLSHEEPASSRRGSLLSRLSTKGLPASNLKLSIPQTPSRFGNFAAFSPAHSALMLGNMDLSSWLDDPVLPSPLYELGACTGWNGFMPGFDVGKTPTAHSSRANDRYLLKGPSPSNTHAMPTTHELAPQSKSSSGSDGSTPISPVLISSEDWWARDKDAQWRYHRYMYSSLPVKSLLHPNYPKTTLATSAVSRFLTYCTFLCLVEPNAPQPPFLHRQLLVAWRDHLPESLAVARCVLAALTLRLPSSEAYAWGLAARELDTQIRHAHETAAKLSVSARRSEKAASTSPLNARETIEVMALCQTLWFYVVVAAFGDSFDRRDSQGFTLIHRFWDPALLSRAVDALQSLTALVAHMLPDVEKTPASEAMRATSFDDDTREFLWWSVGESLRRTVLASHALLVLLQYCLHFTQGAPAPMLESVTPGSQPYPAGIRAPMVWSMNDWQNIMAVELPAVADTFEADSASTWRSYWDNHQPIHNARPTLSLFHSHRPAKVTQPRSEMQFWLESYLHQHDEFTNVCLSILFGLTSDGESPPSS